MERDRKEQALQHQMGIWWYADPTLKEIMAIKAELTLVMSMGLKVQVLSKILYSKRIRLESLYQDRGRVELFTMEVK